MKSSRASESERNRLNRIAADYQSQGYDVKVQPRLIDLPDFLVGFEPDLIASGKGEMIVVEVKTRGDLASAPVAPELEAAIRSRPGWRFEVIIDGIDEPQQTLTATQIRALLEEATELEQRKHPVAALLVLWTATEAALRLLASRENVELESLAPGYLVTRLYTLGLLERGQYQRLNGAMHLRNHAAHGFQVAVTSENLSGIAIVLNELLKEVEVGVA